MTVLSKLRSIIFYFSTLFRNKFLAFLALYFPSLRLKNNSNKNTIESKSADPNTPKMDESSTKSGGDQENKTDEEDDGDYNYQNLSDKESENGNENQSGDGKEEDLEVEDGNSLFYFILFYFKKIYKKYKKYKKYKNINQKR